MENFEEYLLNKENNRLTVYPISNNIIWSSYKKQQAAFWTAEEIDFSKDYDHFNNLNENEQYFIKMILAFFSSSDTIVNINLADRFLNDVQIREAIITYTWQMAMESIHCVSGDTLILTDTGFYEIKTLENVNVNVWNGNQFSSTVIQYTGKQKLYDVILSNGLNLKCTDEHKWFIDNNNKKEIIYTKNLSIGNKIFQYELPIIDFDEDTHNNKSIYLQGYMFGSGFIDFNYVVPINYKITSKITWLTGFFDQVNYIIKDNKLIISYNNYDLLKDVQLLLLTFNIHSQVYYTNNLVIFVSEFIKLYDFNYKPKPKLYNEIKNINCDDIYTNCKDIYIIDIYEFGEEDTYCFNEPLEHAGVFNGILTGQSETYSLQIDNIIKDPIEKNKLFNALKEFPFVAAKANWAFKWIESNECFAKRLLAFAIVEGIFFSGSFCSIFWLKKRNIMPGLCNSNELIARDEGLHCAFAILLYSMLNNKLLENEVHDMFKEAVEIEIEFICKSLPCKLLGMNSDLMAQYIKYVSDRLLTELNYSKIYNVSNPFDFMESISVEGKTNFFESRPTQYQKSSILNKSRDNIFELNENF